MTDIETSRINEIVSLYQELEVSLKTSFEKALRIGELLTQQKGSMKHGKFMPWLEQHLPFITDRTARRWMALYGNRTLLKTESVSDLTTAYKLLESPKDRQAEFEGKITQAKKIDDSEERLRALVAISTDIKATQRSDAYNGCYCRCRHEMNQILAPPTAHETIGFTAIQPGLHTILKYRALFSIKQFIPTIEWAEESAKQVRLMPPFETREKAIECLMSPSPEFFLVLISYFETISPNPEDETDHISKLLRLWRGNLFERMSETLDFTKLEGITLHKIES